MKEHSNFIAFIFGWLSTIFCLVVVIVSTAIGLTIYAPLASLGMLVSIYIGIDAHRRQFRTGHRDEWYVPTVLEGRNPLILTKKQRLVEIHSLLRDIDVKLRGVPEGQEKERLKTRQQELRAVGAAIEEERDRKSLDKIHKKVEKVVQRELRG